jgi:polyphosphate glucokinase
MARKKHKLSGNGRCILVVDVGGSNVKLRSSADHRTAKFKSGKTLTASQMAERARRLTSDWQYDAVSIGFPGPVVHGRPQVDPVNIGGGWTRLDFEKVFRKPVKVINDAAMQALGSYEGGRMLFIGLGTGLGSALIVDDVVVPLELGEVRYSRGKTLEDVLGKRGFKKLGRTRWRKAVDAAVANLKAAFVADYVMIGGGNVKKLKRLPAGARRGSNRHAFRGGVRLWQASPIAAKMKKRTLIIT